MEGRDIEEEEEEEEEEAEEGEEEDGWHVLNGNKGKVPS